MIDGEEVQRQRGRSERRARRDTLVGRPARRTGSLLVAALIGGALLTACGGSESESERTGSPGELQVELDAKNDARIAGARAVLTYDGKQRTTIRVDGVDVTGASGERGTPARVVRGGCEKPGSQVYPLKPVRAGVSETTLDVSLPTLLEHDYAIVVLFNGEKDDEPEVVACGELPDEAPGA